MWYEKGGWEPGGRIEITGSLIFKPPRPLGLCVGNWFLILTEKHARSSFQPGDVRGRKELEQDGGIMCCGRL